eukprot:c14114_g1_i1.p1 GENE.c14114_g1_i1~~c14114_g1_i1.p1  ORF type:complete len:1293 (+),score=373.40 c14114_g1_i1:49-3879(+)
MAEDAEFKPGHFQVQVHVIEARDIKDSNPSPKVLVTVMDQKKATPTVKHSFSPFFDHLMFWELPDMTLDTFEYGKINISLFDTNTPLRQHLIGSYEFDFMNIYQRPNHELYKTWIALTDPTDTKEGVQALLKVSITLLGPGDEPVIRKEDEEDKNEEGAEETELLMPPRMPTEDHLLFIQVHHAKNLPKVDGLLQGGSIDPFIVVNFAGVTVQTRSEKNNQNPVFNEQLAVPVTLPCMADRVKIILMDFDQATQNDIVATSSIRFSSIPLLLESELGAPPKGAGYEVPAKALTRWVHFYGPRGKAENAAALKMREGKTTASTHIGSALISCWHVVKDNPKKGVTKINSIPKERLPAETLYRLRCNILSGGQLPISEASIELAWGDKSEATKKKKGKNGVIQWEEPLNQIDLSTVAKTLPDVFLYLVSGDKYFGSIRIPAEKVMKEYNLTLPKWSTFVKDDVVDAFKGTICGELLFTMSLGPASEVGDRAPLVKPAFVSCTLYTYLYFASDLPALDQGGDMDPYALITFSGGMSKSKTIKDTRFPVWGEVMSMKVDVLQPIDLAPAVTVMVYDYDETTADDLAGRITIPATALPSSMEKPQLYTLEMDGKKTNAKILIGFQLVPESLTFKPPASLSPDCEERLVELTIIGLRNLLPYGYQQIMKPFITVKFAGQVQTTKRCNKPTGTDPNFLTLLSFKTMLPKDPLYCAPIQVYVFDDRLVLGTPLIASCAIDLAPFYDPSTARPRSVLTRLDEPVAATGVLQPASALATVTENTEQQSLLDGVEKSDDQAPAVEETESDSGDEELAEVEDKDAEQGMLDTSSKYMTGRETLPSELEDVLRVKPFHEVKLGRPTSSTPRKAVGTLKCNVFALPPGADPVLYPRPFSHAEFSNPRHYVVRLYVLKGINVTAKDSNGLSDPLLKIQLGRKTIIDTNSIRPKTINPEFYCFYELDCVLPGQAHLNISVMDEDLLRYELIGSTTIDLENYFFSEEWHRYAKKPVERRTLKSDLTPSPQGTLECWVDILDPRVAAVVPPIDISPPPLIDFEFRVIVLKAEGIPAGDYIGDMSDMYVRVELLNNNEKQVHDTDVHWRATKGAGSFNYRLKFDVKLPLKKPRLSIQVWDQDIIGASDPLGEAIIHPRHIKRAMTRAYQTLAPTWMRLSSKRKLDEAADEWISLTHPEKGKAGRVLCSFEFIPKSTAHRKPAGVGRKEPNSNPYLPPPNRVQWNFLRPDLILRNLIGADLFNRIRAGLCCIVYCVCMFFFMYFFGNFASILNLFF